MGNLEGPWKNYYESGERAWEKKSKPKNMKRE